MDEEHVRTGEVADEDLARPLGQHHGCHRPELLPALHVVEALDVGLLAGVGQQAAVAQGPGAVLATALEPGHDPVVRQHLGRGLGQVGRTFERHRGHGQPRLDLVVRPLPAEGGRRHR